MVKRALLALSLLISAPIIVFGAPSSIGLNSFSGIDTQDNPSALQPNQSQDLQNVRLQPGGRSVFKRDGYGLFQTINSTYTTKGIHGGYHFQQSGGSDVQLWASSTTLYGIVNDASAVALATGTVDATWQCTDNLGFAYCVTSAGDSPVKTDGTSANTSYHPEIPLGTMITSTPLQLVIAGVSGSPSTLYFSANNNFLNFTVGPLPTDPYQEIINSPGSRLTTLGYYFGNLYWWKDQSMGYVSGSSAQGTVGITIVSNQIGTLDNSSAFWNPTTYDQGNKFNSGTQTISAGNPYFNEMSSLGGIFFRGQDNHVYQYDGYSLTRLSRIITPNVTASSRRKANSWTQSTQTDWQLGTSTPSVNFSFTVSPGDVSLSSFTAVDTSSTDFNLGTTSNVTVEAGDITVSTNAVEISNNSFETGDFTNWTNSGMFVSTGELGTSCGCSITPKDGTYIVSDYFGTDLTINVVDAVTGSILSTTVVPWASGSCAWTERTATVPSNYLRKSIKIKLSESSDTLFSDSFVSNSNDVKFWTASGARNASCTAKFTSVDLFHNAPKSNTSGSFISQTFDTGITSTVVMGQSNWTVGVSTPYFEVQSATSSTGSWIKVTSSSNTNATNGSRYVRYVSSFTTGSTINDVTVIAKSTGGVYSTQVDNAPNLTTWNTFSASDQTDGGSLTYYTRASTNSFTIASSTPAWVAQTKNSAVATSTGTFFQARVDFNTTSATATLALNDLTFNWFEGTAGDKAYIQYFQDAIWFAVSSGSSTSKNNTVFYLDLLNSTWLKDNIAANGFAVENNALYIGDPSSPKVYKFGGVTTDNGNAIQSYWKSKDFTGDDPTVKQDWNQSDFSFAAASNTVTYTYLVDQSTSTTFTSPISLYSPSSSIIKRGFTLDRGSIGTYYNFSIGDNSSLPAWTLMGVRTTYIPLPWRPQVSN